MSHLSAAAFGVLAAVAAVVAVALIASGPGRRGPGPRFAASLAAALLLAGFFVSWISATHHRALTATAASSHMSAANIRSDALIGITLALTVVLFAVTTAMQPRTPAPAPRRARRRAAPVR
jgi:hypothetical protein